MKFLAIFLSLLSLNAHSQVATASFFPSMKSINPGITHTRTSGFLAIDASVKSVDRHQDSQVGGLKDGVQIDVEMNKKTFFRAGKGGGTTFEFLVDQEEGVMNQTFEDLSGKVDREMNAKSTFWSGIIDFAWLGFMVGQADYKYRFFLEADEPPDYWAIDNDWSIDYDLFKLGTTFDIGSFTLGVFYLSQKGEGLLNKTYYNPSTTEVGSRELYKFSSETKGYGVGLGYLTKTLHLEISHEAITSERIKKPSDLPVELDEPELSSRMTLVAEAKLKWFAIGVRLRQIAGNFYDLEDVITSKLLYEDLQKNDVRTETTFNFSFGDQKGITYSAFYSSEETQTEEPINFLDNGEVYPTKTKSQAFGVNVSYIY